MRKATSPNIYFHKKVLEKDLTYLKLTRIPFPAWIYVAKTAKKVIWGRAANNEQGHLQLTLKRETEKVLVSQFLSLNVFRIKYILEALF